VEGPDPRVLRVHEDVEPLTGRDHQRVGHVAQLGVEHEPVLGHHLEVEAVEMHRMDLGAVVRQVDQHFVAEVRDDGLCRRELLAVQHVARGAVTEEQRALDVDPLVVHAAPVPALGST